MMRGIPLTQGHIALVDDEDFVHVNLFKWYAKKSKKSWYAVRKEHINRHSMRGSCVKRKDTRKTIRMHNYIMEPTGNQMVHHKNRNGLDNRRSNLELCTFAQNAQYAQDAKKQREEDNNPLDGSSNLF